MKSGSKPKEPPEAEMLRARQVEQLAELDEQENLKIKRMLNASRGSRMYRNSPSSRGLPSNTSGRPMYAPRGTGGGGVAGGGSAGGYGNRRGSRSQV